MKFKYLSFFLLSILICSAAAQEIKLDSLMVTLEEASGKDRIQILNEIGRAYWGVSTEKVFEFSKQALDLSRELGEREGEAQSLNNIGVAYYYLGDYEKSLEYFLNSLKIREELGNKKEIVASLNNIGIIYDDLNKFDRALSYYLKSLEIYEQLDDKIGIAVSLHNIGVVYENLSNYNKALEYLLRSLIVYDEIGDKSGSASSLDNIGIVYKNLSNYDKAIEYHLESLKISKEIDDKNGVARSLDNIGIIYDNLGDYEKAIDYYLQSLEIEEEIGDRAGVAGSYNNIGIIYDDQMSYEKALEFYFNSLEIYTSINDKNGIANAFNNIGVVYENQRKYDKSLKYHLQAMAIFEDIGQKKGFAASLNNIGSVYLKMKNYEKALQFLQHSLEVATEIEIKDLIIEIYQKLSELHTIQNNYRQALHYFKLYSSVKDSVFTKEKIEKIAGLQTTYEVEQLIKEQESEIELLQKDNEIYKLKVEKHNLTKWRLYYIIILIVILVFVIYYLYRMKNKANIHLEKLVEERTADLKNINQQLKQEMAERKRVENQLIRSERLAGIGELAAGIAHEIRNPLGNISSSAQYCLSKYKLNKNMQRYLEIIQEDSHKANAIIKGLLDFANPRELSLQPGSVVDIINGVISSVKARCVENNVKIIKSFSEHVPRMPLDKKWLEQAFMNFIINAIQAMPNGGELKITVLFLSDKNELKVIFLDSGTGISTKNMKKIFDPFFTTREHGVGLGLSLAHQIISDHEGQLYIESKIRKGTRVVVTFPVFRKK